MTDRMPRQPGVATGSFLALLADIEFAEGDPEELMRLEHQVGFGDLWAEDRAELLGRTEMYRYGRCG